MVANAIHPPYGKLSCAAIACFYLLRMDSMYPHWECAMFGDFVRICQQGAQPFSFYAVDSKGQRLADDAACMWGVYWNE